MLSLQQLADIAARHATELARAMLRACAVRACETGEPLRLPEAARRIARRRTHAAGDTAPEEWRAMVERNGETRAAWHG